MRLNRVALGLLLPAAAILTGCGVGNLASSSSASAVSASKKVTGKAFGGQQPVAFSQIYLYEFGTSGYGSTGRLLAQTQTDATGYFNIDPASISCTTPTTPVYILAAGGDPGFGTNTAVELGSEMGRCDQAAGSFITINEISTAMLAYTFAHLFSSGNPDAQGVRDHFGAPASQGSLVAAAYTGTVFPLLDVENGYPRVNTTTTTFEGAKLITLGNILGACVNSGGAGSPSCSALFGYTTPASSVAPVNTLEAAVNVALNPAQNVPYIFALQPQSGAAAFTGGLTAPPADWTLSASYASSTFGLGVSTRTATTIDIDRNGKVWFPSNGPNSAGVGYFDTTTGTFSPLFTSGNLVHPQELAIDVDNTVWVTDASSPNVAGFPAATPNAPIQFSLPGTTSTSVTVAYDNSIRFGIVAADGLPALAEVPNTKDSYSEVPGTEIPNGGGFIPSSIAGDVQGGIAIAGQELSTPTTYDLYRAPNGGVTFITYQTFQDAGQVVFTGNDYVGTRGGYNYGADGICIWSSQGCYALANDAIRHPSSMVLDGMSSLWMTDSHTQTIEQIPFTNGTYLNSSNQANNIVYTHDANNGSTLPAPGGIAVDGLGNVWVSNAGCNTTGCTPGTFVLSQIIGAGAPTITPVSLPVVVDSYQAGTLPSAKPSGTTAK